MAQINCIKPKDPVKEKEQNFKFITGYSQNHSLINKILMKYWHIVKNEPHLENIISDKRCIIYRRARTLKSILAPSQFSGKNTSPNVNLDRKGSFRCGHNKCKCCRNISDKVIILRDIYHTMYMWPQDLGRTTQSLRKRINSHRFNVLKGYEIHSVSNHASVYHQCNFD